MLLTRANILLIGHDQRVIDNVKQAVSPQYTLDIETRALTGLQRALNKEYDLYFIDCRLPDRAGLEVLSEILKSYPEAICIMIDEDPDIDTIMRSAHLGGYDFLKKPLKNDKLERLIPRALEKRWYIQEARRLQEERQNSLSAIAEEQSRLRSVIDSIDDGLLIVNQFRETIFVNQPFHWLVGIQREIYSGENIFDLLPKKLQNQIDTVSNNPNSSCSIKEEIVIEPPAKLVILANTTPILGNQGNLLGTVSVLQDVSEMKALDLAKSEFINMVAHELKAPLGAIKGYLEMIINKDLGENQEMYEQYLKRTLERSNAMLALLQDLLNIFRMDAKTLRREIEIFDAGILLEENLEFFHSNILERGISVEKEIQKDLFIRADREEIRRVYTNLISNAIKYNKDKGIIRIRAYSSEGRAFFDFEDTGIGIREEDIPRLYEEFFRAKNRHTRSISGTGLGMTIMKKIVDEYGGSISVSSVFEKGSTFTVSFPLANPDPAEIFQN